MSMLTLATGSFAAPQGELNLVCTREVGADLEVRTVIVGDEPAWVLPGQSSRKYAIVIALTRNSGPDSVSELWQLLHEGDFYLTRLPSAPGYPTQWEFKVGRKIYVCEQD